VCDIASIVMNVFQSFPKITKSPMIIVKSNVKFICSESFMVPSILILRIWDRVH